MRGFGRTIEIGRRFGCDLLLEPVFRQVLNWASRGVIGGITGQLGIEDFSGRLISLGSKSPWEATDLDGDERQVFDENVVLWLRFLLVTLVAQAALDLKSSEARKRDEELSDDDSIPEGITRPQDLAEWALKRAAVRLQRKREPQIPDPSERDE